MRGKRQDGNWFIPLEPLLRSTDFTEATPWQYRFFIPHDIKGMENLMGGRERMLAAVDSFFHYRPEGQKSFDSTDMSSTTAHRRSTAWMNLSRA